MQKPKAIAGNGKHSQPASAATKSAKPQNESARSRDDGILPVQNPQNGGDATGLRCSLVSNLEYALGNTLGGPEPDYLKWMDGLLFAETGNAFDESIYDGNSPAEREAWKTYREAVDSVGKLLDLHKCNPHLFQKIAAHFSVLPCLMSRHPAARKFNEELFKFSQIGAESLLYEQGLNGPHYAHQSWPVRYAYAIISTIDLSLDTWEDRLPLYAEIYGYGVKHEITALEIEEMLANMKYLSEGARRRYAFNIGVRIGFFPIGQGEWKISSAHLGGTLSRLTGARERKSCLRRCLISIFVRNGGVITLDSTKVAASRARFSTLFSRTF